jgi:hypothetical protein
MATNIYFNNYFSSSEQELIDDLIVESIKIYGVGNFYCPRTLGNFDPLYGTDDVSEYLNNFELEMYVKSNEGFTGDGRFMSKFGMEIRDEITFSIARTAFNNEIGSRTGLLRPNEGDLIFFPLNNKIYVIKFVQQESIFYQLGALQLYDVVCEQWEYSNELLRTGLPQIDKIQRNYSFDMTNYSLLLEGMPFPAGRLTTEDGFDIILEEWQLENTTIADNAYITSQESGIIDFSDADPFSMGDF